MSIHDEIRWHEQHGQLILIRPSEEESTIIRHVYVLEDLGRKIYEAIESPTPDGMYTRLFADIEDFVLGERLYPQNIFWLTKTSDLIFEIRSPDAIPSLRLLGQFADMDYFIGTNLEYRDELGEWDSIQWKRAMRTSICKWRGLFPMQKPLEGEDIHDFVSNAAPGLYFKE